MDTIIIAYCHGANCRVSGRNAEASLPEYFKLATTRRIGAKDGEWHSGAVLIDDCPTPTGKNLASANTAGHGRAHRFDLDKVTKGEWAAMRQRIRANGWMYAAATTNSCRPDLLKLHVILIADRDLVIGVDGVTLEMISVVKEAMNREIFDGKADPASHKPAQLFYLPSHDGIPEAVEAAFEDCELDGKCVDLTGYIAEFAKGSTAGSAKARSVPRSGAKENNFTRAAACGTAGDPADDYRVTFTKRLLTKFGKRILVANIVTDYCEDAALQKDGSVTGHCPRAAEFHTDGKSKDDDLQAYNGKDASGTDGMFALTCFHSHCQINAGRMLDAIIFAFDIPLADILAKYILDITATERLDMLLPAGFGACAGQIVAFKRERRTGPDDAAHTIVVPVPICGQFMLKALARDEMSGGWGKDIEFSDADGRQKRRVVPAALVHADGGELFKELAGAGLWIASDAWERRKFRELLNTWETDERITDVSKPGWLGHNRMTAYMTPLGEIVGEVHGTYRLRDGVGAADREKRGTLRGWTVGVGHAVWGGDTPQFALGVCTGVAGVLVQLAGLDTIGIHFLGESGSGKTISQSIGASCVANPKPDKGVLVSGRSTDNSFESRFERGNGSSVHIDEAKTSNAKILELLIFMAASGVGKGRMRQDSTDKPAKTWSTCWTFSSEKPVASILEGVGGEMVTGTAVRLLSIPMTDCPNIGKVRADAVKRAAEDNYGHALPVFVAEIMRRRLHERPDVLRVLIDAYATNLPATTSAAHRARHAFGVLWFAGELMKRCGLAPVEADIGAMIRWAWDAYVGGAEMLDPKASNMRRVEEYLRTHVGTTVMRRGDDDVPRGEVVAWFDNSLVYLVANQVDKLPGVTLGTREVMKAFDDAGVLDRPPAGRNGLAWTKVPGHGAVVNYRLKMTLRPAETAEERAEVHTASFAENAAKTAEKFRNAGVAADGVH
jgi:uncharacterized protein DUF927